MDDSQQAINILIGIAAFVCGWLLKIIWDRLMKQEVACDAVSSRVSQLEVLVAGDYVKREEFDRMTNRLFKKLDTISDKIDRKADR